jgi:hypothetical protein
MTLTEHAAARATSNFPSRYSLLPSLPVPRPLKLRPIFRLLFVLLSIILIFFAWECIGLFLSPSRTPDDLQSGARLATFLFLLVAGMVWSWNVERRRKRLLRSGNVTLGLVTKSTSGRRRRLPGIVYKLQIVGGKEIEDFDLDWTDSVRAGMTVPVFYDEQNPKNHVAVYASFYDIDFRQRPQASSGS